MTQINDHVSVSAILQTAVAPAMGFGTTLHLIDDDDIPIDQMYRLTDQSSYADDYDVGSDVYNYCIAYFSQKRVPSQLMLGRVILADSSPYYIIPNYNSDYAEWGSISDGAIKIVSGANEDTLSELDFDGCTSMTQVIIALNEGLGALIDPNITGLENAVFSIDSMGRLILTMPNAGSSAVAISSIESPDTGTNLTGEDYLNIDDDCKSVLGQNEESPVDAITRIKQYTTDFYIITERGCNSANQLILAQWVETQEHLLFLVTTDDDAYDATKGTDIGYLVKELSLKRTTVIYTDDSDEYPDSAVIGCVIPADEGSTSFAYEVLAQITESMESGGTVKLSLTDKTALEDKGYCYIETIGDNTYLYDGITCGGEEIRIMLGRDWFVARIRELIFTSMLNEPLHAFDADTFAIVECAIRTIGDEAIARKIIVNTQARPFTVTMPDPDDISTATRASHEFDETDIFEAYLNSAVNDYSITGTWSI